MEQGHRVGLQAHASTARQASILIHSASHWRLEHYVLRNVLMLKRTPKVIDNFTEFARQNSELCFSLSSNCDVRGIIIDMRSAHSRNDAQYEAATARLRTTTYRNFKRVALLFRSVAGALQIGRLGGAHADRTLVTTDQERALLFAGTRASVPPPP